MILKWDDGASGVPPMCFSMPVSQPSILSWHVVEARVGEHDLEDDGRHAPADVFSFRFFSTLIRLYYKLYERVSGGFLASP